MTQKTAKKPAKAKPVTRTQADGRVTAPEGQAVTTKDRLFEAGEKYGLVILTLGIIVFFSVLPDTGSTFASEANWRQLLANQAALLLLALAILISLVGGEIDLSVGGTFGFCTAIFAGLMSTADLPLTGGPNLGAPEAAVLALVVGGAIGLLCGVIVAFGGVTSMIATLGVGIVTGSGLVVWYTDGRSISEGLPLSLSSFGSSTVLGIPVVALIAGAAALLIWHLIENTPFGRQLYASGSSRRAAHLAGIPVRRRMIVGFVLGGLLAAAAGIISVARQGGGVPTDGLNQLIAAFAAVYLGATTIRPGRFNVLGTVVGLFFVATTVSGLGLMGVDAWIQPVVNGTSLVFALLISAYFGRQRSRSLSP